MRYDNVISCAMHRFHFEVASFKRSEIKVCNVVRGSRYGRRIRVHRIVFLFFNKCVRIGSPDSEYVSVPLFPLGFVLAAFDVDLLYEYALE